MFEPDVYVDDMAVRLVRDTNCHQHQVPHGPPTKVRNSSQRGKGGRASQKSRLPSRQAWPTKVKKWTKNPGGIIKSGYRPESSSCHHLGKMFCTRCWINITMVEPYLRANLRWRHCWWGLIDVFGCNASSLDESFRKPNLFSLAVLKVRSSSGIRKFKCINLLHKRARTEMIVSSDKIKCKAKQ